MKHAAITTLILIASSFAFAGTETSFVVRLNTADKTISMIKCVQTTDAETFADGTAISSLKMDCENNGVYISPAASWSNDMVQECATLATPALKMQCRGQIRQTAHDLLLNPKVNGELQIPGTSPLGALILHIFSEAESDI